MASSGVRATEKLTRYVKPVMSLDKSEARRRVLGLYKAWYRQLPLVGQCQKKKSILLTWRTRMLSVYYFLLPFVPCSCWVWHPQDHWAVSCQASWTLPEKQGHYWHPSDRHACHQGEWLGFFFITFFSVLHSRYLYFSFLTVLRSHRILFHFSVYKLTRNSQRLYRFKH